MRTTIRGEGEHELQVKRSRFLCSVGRAHDEAEAREFIARVRRQHWDATHNCTAYVVGESVQRSSDDGEPAGTAGAPMLGVLRHRGLTDTVAVVTRYFGGVKLGASGLIRAYGQAVSRAVDAVGVVELHTLTVVAVDTDYGSLGRLHNGLRESGYEILDTRYAGRPTIDVAVDGVRLGALTRFLAELTGGTARWTPRGTTTVERPAGGDVN